MSAQNKLHAAIKSNHAQRRNWPIAKICDATCSMSRKIYPRSDPNMQLYLCIMTKFINGDAHVWRIQRGVGYDCPPPPFVVRV